MPCSSGTARSKMRFLAEAASIIPMGIVVDVHTHKCESFRTTDCFYRRVASRPPATSSSVDLPMLTLASELTYCRVVLYEVQCLHGGMKTRIAKSASEFAIAAPWVPTPQMRGRELLECGDLTDSLKNLGALYVDGVCF
jgi:hypothetical protein